MLNVSGYPWWWCRELIEPRGGWVQDISLGNHHPGNLSVSLNFWLQQDLGKVCAGPLGARWRNAPLHSEILCFVNPMLWDQRKDPALCEQRGILFVCPNVYSFHSKELELASPAVFEEVTQLITLIWCKNLVMAREQIVKNGIETVLSPSSAMDVSTEGGGNGAERCWAGIAALHHCVVTGSSGWGCQEDAWVST